MNRKGFKSDYMKNINSMNLFKRPKKMIKESEISSSRKERLIRWITFYRRNVHRFVQHYFQIKLHPYQIIWIYLMGVNDTFVAIASRAVGKSWLIAVFACARAVLYPNSLIVIVSSTKEQAGNIVSEKISGLRNEYPNLAREITSITTNMNNYEVKFNSGSTIRVVASRDSARGKRSNFTIYEEFRLIDKSVLDSVIRPFASVRQPPYLKDKKYRHLIEEPKEVFISSAWMKGLWWYDETIKTIKMLLNGDNVGFLATDYLVAIKHGIKTKKLIAKDREKMDEILFLQEYENIPFGESSTSYFKLKMLLKNRVIKRPFYPIKNEDFNEKKFVTSLPKLDNEIRIIAVDVATRAGKANDLTIIGCIRLMPTNKGYHRELVYMESYSGRNTILQTTRIKQIFYDFEADYIVLDIANAGITIFDQLSAVSKDDERGIEYPAMTTMAHHSVEDKTYEDLKQRTIAISAIPVIYPIYASSKLNSQIAVEMRDKLQKRMFSLLINENEAEDMLIQSKRNSNFISLDSEEKANMIAPYVQSSLFVNEAINLSMTFVSGNIKLSEPEGGRKDRYTCVSYGNYFASILDNELLKESGDFDMDELLRSTGFM